MEKVLLIEWPHEGFEAEKLSVSAAIEKFPDLFEGVWLGDGCEGLLADLLKAADVHDEFHSQFCVVHVLKTA